MICPIPNPPMDSADISRFRSNLEKHLRGEFSPEEQKQKEELSKRTQLNANRIIKNSGGKNPLLGY